MNGKRTFWTPWVAGLVTIALGAWPVEAAPVLVTKDNYQSAADSPFDLAGEGFWLEDFEDGEANTPGLIIRDPDANPGYKVIGPSNGAVSVDVGGHSVTPAFGHGDVGRGVNYSALTIAFDASFGGFPTRFGLAVTDLNVASADLIFKVFAHDGSMAGMLTPSFEAGRFYGISLDEGISSVEVRTEAPLSFFPFFQLDHVQYGPVPEPSSLILVALGATLLAVWGHKRVARRL
jgi:hypothetical protein